MKYIVFIFLFLSIGYQSMAQEEKHYDNHLWLEGFFDYSFGHNLDFFADASYRQVFGTENNWNRIMVRPSMKWGVLKWLDIRGGIGIFYSDFNTGQNILEIRPWQGVAIGWPKFKTIKFTHLFRLEQQIIYETESWTHRYTNRYRYLFGTRIKLSKTRKYNVLFIPASVEFFFRSDEALNRLLRNDGRYTMGLGYVFNREITVDLRYFIQRSRSEELGFVLSDNVLRLRFRYNLFHDHEDHTKDH